ncbi:MAG: L-histidine N(alpha)-methyltransferase [Pseudomonadota bacterium]
MSHSVQNDETNPLAFFLDLAPEMSDFRADTVSGLRARPRRLQPKYFYDERGSHLFEKICETDEYYVTRTELALLRDLAPQLERHIRQGATIVEYGAGASQKIRTLLGGLPAPARFIAVDISGDHLQAALTPLAEEFPNIAVGGICADFTDPEALPIPGLEAGEPVLGFLPGSTIGNFAPEQASRFLAGAARHLGQGNCLLIGADLQKDPAVLEAAYNDRAGVTAAFNLNLLYRINRELDGTIDPAAFEHRSLYNADLARVEMHLRAVEDHRFTVGEEGFSIAAGETIHTENSHKYTVDGFQEIAQGAGFKPLDVWVDDRQFFSVHLFEVV